MIDVGNRLHVPLVLGGLRANKTNNNSESRDVNRVKMYLVISRLYLLLFVQQSVSEEPVVLLEEKTQRHWLKTTATFTPTTSVLTCRMSVSTILYRSGMWVTMSVMLSSEVRTSVGPNTRARFLGSIWGTKTVSRKNLQQHVGVWSPK